MSSCSTPWCAEYTSWQIAARIPAQLAGGDRGADAGAADEHAALRLAVLDRLAELARLVRVVDPHRVGVRAEIDGLVAQGLELVEDPLAELDAPVVERHGDSHAAHRTDWSASASAAARRIVRPVVW